MSDTKNENDFEVGRGSFRKEEKQAMKGDSKWERCSLRRNSNLGLDPEASTETREETQ